MFAIKLLRLAAAAALLALPQAGWTVFDPVNEINNVAAVYDESHRQAIVAAAEEALEAISEARFATTRGRAIECWQDVLGASFGG